MYDCNKYLGRPYVEGRNDCYGLARDFFRQEHGLELPNYARPHRFWEDPSLRLYDIYAEFGFEPVIDERIRVGDVLLIPLYAPFETHAAVVVDDVHILHHLPNRLSSLDRMRPRWTNMATKIIRHPCTAPKETTQRHLHEVMDANILRDPKVKDAIAALMERDS